MIFRPHYFTNDTERVRFHMDELTIRPTSPEGDEFFGLAGGTNGTAAITRREVAERAAIKNAFGFYDPKCPRLTWLRFNGKPATGLQLVPGDASEIDADPWGGDALAL